MEKKQRYSHQREEIMEYLSSTTEHPSADMVYTHLKATMPSLSLGTVYRNLKLLEESGRIRRVTTPQNVERYDARCCDHGHFVCERCGSVKDLSVIDPQAARQGCELEEGDRVQWVNLIFGGVCAACAAAAE